MNVHIDINEISKRYGNKTAVDKLSLSMGRGIYGLVGPNGAGKTTLLKMLAGLLKPDGGSVLYNGKDIKDMGREYNRHVSYMPQEFGFYPFFKGIEIMEYFNALKGCNASREELLGILEAVNLSDKSSKKVRTYSGGMKRRLGIAVSLIGSPDFMIFDEPTAGLDPEERVRFKTVLKEMSKERTIIISTHILSDVEALCDTVIFMESGRIVKESSPEKTDGKITGELEDRYLEIIGSEANETDQP